MRKLLVLLPWAEFLDVHLVKDVGLFPEYFSKEYDISVDFVFLDNIESGTIKNEYHGMRLIKLNPLDKTGTVPRFFYHPFKFLSFLKIFTEFLKENKNVYSHIMMFHINSTTLFFVKFIKKLDKNIKIYIKADAASFTNKQWCYFKNIIKRVDALSIESEFLAKNTKEKFKTNAEKIRFVPNGFDDKNFDKNLLSLQKENLIIQTARFGTAQKNTQLLLKILSNANLRNWKVVLAGTIEDDFLPYIKSFFEKYPNLKEKIDFCGNISDRDRLYELYAKAKIFILTSRFESFSLSVMESAFFGDYIISTNVGISETIKNNFGGFVAQENPMQENNDEKIAKQMSDELQKCIGNPEYCSVCSKNAKKIRSYFSMSNIVKTDFYKEFFD